MLKSGVFAFSMFTNDNEIKIVMTSFQTFKILDTTNIGIDIQWSTKFEGSWLKMIL